MMTADSKAPSSEQLKVQSEQRDESLFVYSLSIDAEPFTEGGNASRLIVMHGDDMRYCHTHKKWYSWDGARWRMDEDGAAKRAAEHVVQYLYYRAQNASSPTERGALAAAAMAADSSRALSNILEIAKNRSGIAITWQDLDPDPWLLGAGDMTLDLRAVTARPSRREDMISKQIGCKYDPEAKCERWDKFLVEVFPDEQVRAFVQRAIGYSLTGSMAEEAFFLCWGLGANGKSKFLSAIRALMGDYAKHASFTTFLVQRSDRIRNDLAALAGAHFITSVEAKDGSEFDMELLKGWTGGEPIRSRFLYAEEFEYPPAGKLWFAANRKPRITAQTHEVWRRVYLIPFTVTIPKKLRDKHLEGKLLAELSGILNWALEGLREYLVQGLNPPVAVIAATRQYEEENDSLSAFITECCVEAKDAKCNNSELWEAYDGFCLDCGYKALSKGRFREALLYKGYTKTRSNQGMVWHSIGLRKEGSVV